MYSEGNTIKEISKALDRQESEVEDRIKLKCETFRNMAIVMMSQKTRVLEKWPKF